MPIANGSHDHAVPFANRSYPYPTASPAMAMSRVSGPDGTTSKSLLLNLDTLGIPLDNVEGMTFGPRLRGGKRTLLLVSDNNFAPSQFTQFLLFALD